MTQPRPGIPEAITDNIRRVLAPNPGPMTHWGTNTYVLGRGQVAIIDPGPESETHLAGILAATAGETITHILVTHAHADHSPLARALSRATGAPVYGFGPPEAGRSSTMERLAKAGLSGGGEGTDAAFQPDETLSDGDVLEGEDWNLTTFHTPGHFAGHLAFQCDGHLFSGDHVMDWASSLVSPPDGDLGAFLKTSERLKTLSDTIFLPGHGNPIRQPAARLDWLIQHRKGREDAILAALESGANTVDAITSRVYVDTPPEMHPAAARNAFAHLIDLVERNVVRAVPELSLKARFEIV